MEVLWIKERVTYDGSQLRPLFAYMEHGILGDSIVGWRGPCDIPSDKIVDGEDLRAGARICGSDMVHFVLEFFGHKLHTAVSFQRLLVSLAKDLAQDLSGQASGLKRRGDDLYLDEKKFNISIASVSAVSAMIHIAFNVETKGTPVATLSLSQLGIEPEQFAQRLLKMAQEEFQSIDRATKKVRPL